MYLCPENPCLELGQLPKSGVPYHSISVYPTTFMLPWFLLMLCPFSFSPQWLSLEPTKMVVLPPLKLKQVLLSVSSGIFVHKAPMGSMPLWCFLCLLGHLKFASLKPQPLLIWLSTMVGKNLWCYSLEGWCWQWEEIPGFECLSAYLFIYFCVQQWENIFIFLLVLSKTLYSSQRAPEYKTGLQ